MTRYRSNAERPRCDTTGKVELTHDEAHRAARNLNSNQQRDRDPVHAYRCNGCGRWHTGHVPPPLAKRRRKERRGRR